MGGKAFDNVELVVKHRIKGVLEWFEHYNLLIPGQYRLLGSSGKKAFSGDIDIAITDYSKHSHYAYLCMVEHLQRHLGHSNVNTHGISFKQIYTRFDQDGGPPIQVDFMMGDIELLEYTHWSPDGLTSEYNGRHRTEYLKAVAKAQSQVFSKDGRVLARVGFTLHHDRGLQYSARWHKPKVDGTGYVVKMTHVEETDLQVFKEHFPSLDFAGEYLVPDPQKITSLLFGEGTTPSMVNSYEQIAALIKSNPELLQISDLIWQLFTERLLEIKQQIPERLI